MAKDIKTSAVNEKAKDMRCGIVVPISPHPDYANDHWKDVLNIIIETINETQFKPNLVSDDEAIGLIHERIVTNIYNNEMIVCDVSSKNPNVMFELGLRLAFDKPVIIIKDDKTSYTFDTGVIEHISYPSSLRFGEIVNFKKELAKRIEATYKKSVETTNYSPFLKGFGKTIIPAKIQGEEITETKFLIDQIYALKDEMKRLRFDLRNNNNQVDMPSSPLGKNVIGSYLNELLKKTGGRASKEEFVQFVANKRPELSEREISSLIDMAFRADIIEKSQ